MGLRSKTRMKVWEFENTKSKAGKDMLKIKVTTSKKVGDTWQTDFSSYALVFGEAKKKLEGRLTEGCPIVVNEFDLTMKYSKEHGKTFTNFAIFDADLLDEKGEVIPYDEAAAKKAQESAPSAGFMNIAEDLPDLPFN